MAGTVVTPPHGFEIVGDAVPTVEHWKSFAACPADFEPNDVWGFVQKVKETSSGKLLSWCVFAVNFMAAITQPKCCSIRLVYTAAKLLPVSGFRMAVSQFGCMTALKQPS